MENSVEVCIVHYTERKMCPDFYAPENFFGKPENFEKL